MAALPDWLLSGYRPDPLLLVLLLVSLFAYCLGVTRLWRRAGFGRGIRVSQLLAFVTGSAVSAAALLSPLEQAAHVLFSAHMVQHMLLAFVAAPLLAWSAPALALLWALPQASRSGIASQWLSSRFLRRAVAWLSSPFTVLLLFTLTFWIWHAPAMYEAAIGNPPLHALEHFTMLGSGFGFWWLVLQPTGRRRLPYGAAILFVLVAMLQGLVLASLIAFAQEPLYGTYVLSAEALGLDALQDQQLAAMIMRTPATIILLVAAIWLFLTWMAQLERRDVEFG